MQNINTPKKSKSWIRWIGYTIASLLLLTVIAYFVVTSSSFITGVILPRASKTIGADITADSVEVHPFSKVVISNLKVQAPGQPALFTANEVSLSYSLMDIIRGHINVSNVSVNSPTISLIEDAKGNNNLQPILAALNKPQAASSTKPSASSASGKSAPPEINLTALTLNDVTFIQQKTLADGSINLTEVTNLNLTIGNVGNGKTGTLVVKGNVLVNQTKANTLAATLDGNISFTLSADLKPTSAQGGIDLSVASATGTFVNLQTFKTSLACELSPTEIKDLSLKFSKAGQSLGQLQVRGPLNAETQEGDLTMVLSQVDKQLLNSLNTGTDFGTTALSSSNHIHIAKLASAISVIGSVSLQNAQVTQKQQTTPTLDLKAGYNLTFAPATKTLTLSQLSLNGTQQQQPLLAVELTKPMTLSLGAEQVAAPDATLSLSLTNFNLADWKAFTSGAVSAGQINSTVTVNSQKAGKALEVAVVANLTGITTPTAQLNTGTVELLTHLQLGESTTAQGQFDLKNLSGEVNGMVLNQLSSSTAFAIENKGTQLNVKQLDTTLAQNSKAGGSIAVTGTIQTLPLNANLSLNIADLNQNILGIVLQPMLGAKKLQSVSFNSKVTANYGNDQATVKGDLQVTNLVVVEPDHTVGAPLGIQLGVDVSVAKGAAQINQVLLKLKPTNKAANQLLVSGNVNFAQATNLQGVININSDGLDLTAYYDLFAAKQQAKAKASANANAVSAPVAVASNPAPTALPFNNFKVNLNIKQIALHEVAITNWITSVTLNPDEVSVQPLQLVMNQGTVNASLEYTLSSTTYACLLDIKGVPIAPITDTFMPATKGQYNGTINSHVQVHGKGTTGLLLKQNLAGGIQFALTNADIQLMASGTKVLFIPINMQLIATLLNMPELMQSPVTGINLNVVLGQGQINVQQAEVVSPAFKGDLAGIIPIADVLTNSPLDMPLQVSLTNSLAKRFTVANQGASYSTLPTFLTVTGTIGNPQTKKNTLVLASLSAEAISGIAGGNSKVGGLLKAGGGILGILGGNHTNNSQPKSPPSGQSNGSNNLFKLFGK